MPKPIALKIIIKVLTEKGFVFVRQKGSHARYRKKNSKKTVNVTLKTTKKEVPYGTFRSIVLQSGLREEDFLA